MKHYCVISHTHWDREWYQTQEEFRLRLIDLFDHLLDILDTNPEYIFHMDAQTIVFEDYWEVRPEMKEKCCRYIQEGRILAGPWYVQNDFFLTSGEATVRNLLLGVKQAEEWGGCAKTGYTPDQFGLISQLPQIFQGFGIDHCVFGRGYAKLEEQEDGKVQVKAKPSEFVWKSPDGSKVLAIHMSHWYNNAQRFSADIDRAYKLVQSAKQSFEGIATTPYLLLMNGVDHLEPQEDLLPVLQQVQDRLSEEEQIYQTSLEHYVKCVRNAKAEQEMPIEIGELMQGGDENLLKDTASSRAYLKRENSEIQNMLEHRLEPLYTLLELSGMEGVYPSGHLDYLWKMLIKNHAHDSICGCSKDAVHNHMEDRFLAIREMADELMRRGLKQLAAHATCGCDKNDYQIVVFNGLERKRTEVVDVTVDIAASDYPSGIKIVSPDGRIVPFVVKKQYAFGKSIFSAINLPGTVETIRYEIRMLAEDIPAFGYAIYCVKTGEQTMEYETANSIATEVEGVYCLENNSLKVTVQPNGRIDLFAKEMNVLYEDILTVWDVADLGNTYIFKAMEGDIPVDVRDDIPTISIEESDRFSGTIRLHYEVEIPTHYDAVHNKRSDDRVTIPLDIYLRIEKDAKALGVRLETENDAKDHRMSAVVRTGIDSDVVVATSPYDVVSRNKWNNDIRICNETEHTSGMVCISNDVKGIAVLNRGVYAYEHLQQEQGTLTFPIVRATGVISAGVESDDDAWKTPGNQCLRKMVCELALMPQSGHANTADAVFAANAFQNPLVVQCEPVDTRKFLGGRAAVQDTGIAELFYQDVPYPEVELGNQGFGMLLTGQDVQVTAWKKSFDRSGYILRFYNPKEEVVPICLNLGELDVKEVWKTNLAETAREGLDVKEHRVCLDVKAKEIVTLYMK